MTNDIEKNVEAGGVPRAVAHRPTRIGNPGTLGLFSFASTTFILSLYNVRARGVATPNVIVGNAAGCGGLAQLLAGMWEFPRGNTFGATAFSSYGAFWIAYAIILIPGSGALEAYTDPRERENALGMFLVTWSFVTFFFCFASLRKSIGFIALFGLLSTTLAVLAAGAFTGSVNCTKGGGGVGIATALVAFYIGLSELLAAEEKSVVRFPIGVFTKRVD
ncbi:hypothetical protein AMATHDRAFT_137211 [Amanita thiersii Skay4041]|uniref:Uncharacterized protein n=1 Tax=Amanita thiersii Skay4041 TaxID=703135 RepID=A0A2A9NZN6_9AGAR|nr:hypothetical protein AMATHDRAFT_137211 [Amanita thiersii Skay4041]